MVKAAGNTRKLILAKWPLTFAYASVLALGISSVVALSSLGYLNYLAANRIVILQIANQELSERTTILASIVTQTRKQMQLAKLRVAQLEEKYRVILASAKPEPGADSLKLVGTLTNVVAELANSKTALSQLGDDIGAISVDLQNATDIAWNPAAELTVTTEEAQETAEQAASEAAQEAAGQAQQAAQQAAAEAHQEPAQASAQQAVDALTEAQTAALTVGDVNVGEKVADIIQIAQHALNGITDVASAEAAVPKLNDINGQLEGLSGPVGELPDDAKKVLADLIRDRITELNALADELTSQEGVGGVVKPALEPIMAKLNDWAQQPA